MKKITLITFLVALSTIANCQKNTMINSKDLSPFSFGVMPVVFVAADKGAGFGLELNTHYGVTDDFGVGIFARMKSILEEGRSNVYNDYGPEPSSFESTNVFAVGASLDHNLFRAIALQVRGGFEVEADVEQRKMVPRAIYGGGIIISFGRSRTHKVSHSLRIGVDFESNRTLDMSVPTVDFSDFPYSQSASSSEATINAFSIQVGWNFQFHGIKRGR